MKLSKKQIILFSSLGFLFLIIIFALSILAFHLSKCNIAFYALPENIEKTLKEEIKSSKVKNITFSTIKGSDTLTPFLASRYNIIFTWKGKSVERIAKSSVKVSQEAFKEYPSQIAKSGQLKDGSQILPLLLDHYEIAYYQNALKETSMEVPQNLSDLEDFLILSKKSFQTPLMINGSDDSELLGFVSLMAHSMLGTEKYIQLMENIPEKITSSYEFSPEFKEVLDQIKKMQTLGLLHKKWFQAKDTDIDNFMEFHQISALVMSLSEHRERKMSLIQRYESGIFPPEEPWSLHGIICPEVCAVLMDKKSGSEKVLTYLSSRDVQTRLSEKTKLSPVNARCQAYDRQADDVRFWAASSSSILPSISEGALVNDSQRQNLPPS